jgi:hypothetical protein
MKGRSKLLAPLSVALGIFVLINLAMERWHHRLPTSIKLAKVESPSSATVLIVGNSLLDSYVDSQLFSKISRDDGEDLEEVDAALQGSPPPIHYLLFRRAESTHPVKTVVIGFMDFQLTAPTREHAIDILGSSVVAFDRRIPAAEVINAFGFDSLDQLEFNTIRDIPTIAYRQNAWKYVEILRRKLSAVGMPPEKETFAELEWSNLESYDLEAQTFAANPTHLNRPMELLLKDCRDHGYRVILILMPLSPDHLAKFYSRASWVAYKNALECFAEANGLQFVDGTSWFIRPQDFQDKVHLAEQPNLRLTEHIADVVNLANNREGKRRQASQGNEAK